MAKPTIRVRATLAEVEPEAVAIARMDGARAKVEMFASTGVTGAAMDDARDALTGETIKVAQRWFGRSVYDDNPDDLVQNKGINLRVYRRMMADPYIKAAITQVKAAVVSPGSEFLPPDGADEREVEATEFVKWNFSLGQMQTSIDDVVWASLGALENGFSIQEKIMEPVHGGRWDGNWKYRAIKDKDPDLIRFDLDPYANVKSIVNLAVDRTGEAVDPRRVYYFVNNPQYGNPWGQSELRAAHRAWRLKDVVYKLWAMYAERNVTPLVIGRFPAGNAAVKERMEKIVENIQFSTAITLPSVEGVSIDVMNTSGMRGTLDWGALIELLNKEIAVGILTAFLGMEEGSNVGSRAATEVHADIASEVVKLVARRQAGSFTIQVIAPLVGMNYGPEVRPPVFAWKGRPAVDLLSHSIIAMNLHNAGAPLSLSGLRQRFGDIVADSFDGPDVIGRAKEDVANQVFSELAGGRCCDHELFSEGEDKVAFTRSLTPVEKFAEPELRRFVKWQNAVAPDVKFALRSAFREVFREALDAVKRKRILEKKDASLAVKVPVDVTAVKEALVEVLMNAEVVGFVHVVDMIRRRGLADLMKEDADLEDEANLGASAFRLDLFKEDGDPDELLSRTRIAQFFRDRVPVAKGKFRELIEQFGIAAERTAVTAAGLAKRTIEAGVQKLVVRAIAEGMDFVQFRDAFRKVEGRYVDPSFERVGKTRDRLPDHQVENIYRTNLFSAYNDGQREAFEDPLVQAVLPAYQYSAILDDRTTEFCQEWDGFIAPVTDPVWSQVRPPNHFQCRSTLVPVDVREYNPDMDTKKRPTVGPQEGFGKLPGARPFATQGGVSAT